MLLLLSVTFLRVTIQPSATTPSSPTTPSRRLSSCASCWRRPIMSGVTPSGDVGSPVTSCRVRARRSDIWLLENFLSHCDLSNTLLQYSTFISTIPTIGQFVWSRPPLREVTNGRDWRRRGLNNFHRLSLSLSLSQNEITQRTLRLAA